MEVGMRNPCLVLPLLLAGCATAPLESAQPACAATRFPEDRSIGSWSVDKFAGRYRSGDDLLYVTREGEHRFIVQRKGYGKRELATATDNVDSWKFRDGCGLAYQFVLPPDGPGAWLKIIEPTGRVSDWNRG
jgi:hypothetical protein